MCFNSRTRVGATWDSYGFKMFHMVSIHAPVWVRLQVFKGGGNVKRFNSRTRVGATALKTNQQ